MTVPPDRSAPSPRGKPEGTIDTIDRYQLVARLGKGGMAEVFRAKLQSIGGFERDVALKVLLPSFAAEPEFVEMLLDEARIAGAIDHPNVLQVIDVGRRDEIFYLVMEYIDGLDLRSIAKQIPGGRIPLGMALYCISEMLRGLNAVHTATDERGQPRDIVHRDISPGNVMIDRRGFVKLGDFGIAHASGRITRTRVGAVKGKSRYMAPEQLAGLTVDARADLYAVGVTLFEAILGDFARESSTPSIYGPMFTWPERIPQGALPPDVEAILRRAITPTAEGRYRDAVELRDDLAVSLQRWAPGYGPDTLARELARLAPKQEMDTAQNARVEADSTQPATASRRSVSQGVSVRPVRWRGMRTAEHTLPPEKTQPPSEVTPIQDLGMHRHEARSELTPVQGLGERPASAPSLPGLRNPSSLVPGLNHSGFGLEPERTFEQPAVPSGALGARGERRISKRLGLALVVASLAFVTIAIAAAVATTGAPAPVAPDVPRVVAVPVRREPQSTPLPATGAVDINGPLGALVQIGGTSYAPAPTRIELPPGDYVVKLRVGKKRRLVTYPIRIEAGRTTSLR